MLTTSAVATQSASGTKSKDSLARVVPIRHKTEHLINLRDLSSIDPGHISHGVAMRCALPTYATPNDRIALEKLGVTQIIDLRGDDEVSTVPMISGLRACTVRHVPLIVTPWNTDRLAEGVGIQDYLASEYRTMLVDSGEQINAVLQLITDHDGVTLFHCTAGKDRTGLIAALLGVIAAAPINRIIDDYALSAAAMPHLLDLFRQGSHVRPEMPAPVSNGLLHLGSNSDPSVHRSAAPVSNGLLHLGSNSDPSVHRSAAPVSNGLLHLGSNSDPSVHRSAAPVSNGLLHLGSNSDPSVHRSAAPVVFNDSRQQRLFFASPAKAMEQTLASVFPFPHRYFDSIGYSRAARRHLQSRLIRRSQRSTD